MAFSEPLKRNLFIKTLGGLCLGFTGWIWYRMMNYQSEKERRQEFRHGTDLPAGISHWGKYYIFRNGDLIQAFSTTCTHAGCLIGRSNGDFLQCSCHGSRFDGKTGIPVRGPALKPLKEFKCSFDEKTEQWIVRLDHESDNS